MLCSLCCVFGAVGIELMQGLVTLAGLNAVDLSPARLPPPPQPADRHGTIECALLAANGAWFTEPSPTQPSWPGTCYLRRHTPPHRVSLSNCRLQPTPRHGKNSHEQLATEVEQCPPERVF